MMSRTSKTLLESDRTMKAYLGEQISNAPLSGNIAVVNNKIGKPDTITVSGIVATDKVKVYSAATGGVVLGTVTVATSQNMATISITQLGTTSGSVYVSVTSVGKLESARTAQTYTAEI